MGFFGFAGVGDWTDASARPAGLLFADADPNLPAIFPAILPTISAGVIKVIRRKRSRCS